MMNSLRLVILLLSSPALIHSARGASEIADPEFKLDPMFGPNMVLQQSHDTFIGGKASPNRQIWVEFRAGKLRPPPQQAQASLSGEWQIRLNLEAPGAVPVGEVSIWEGEKRDKRKGCLTLTNVAVGHVWLLAVPRNQGVLARLGETAETPNRESIRLLNLSKATGVDGLASRGEAAWRVFPPPAELNQFPALVIRLGHHFASSLTNASFVGIVQVLPEDLEAGIRPGASETPDAARFRDKTWWWVNQSVRNEQDKRWNALIQSKRQGTVTTISPLFEYAPPVVYSYESFSKTVPPASRFTFGGVIWPRLTLK
jgi:hypothetical protein